MEPGVAVEESKAKNGHKSLQKVENYRGYIFRANGNGITKYLSGLFSFNCQNDLKQIN